MPKTDIEYSGKIGNKICASIDTQMICMFKVRKRENLSCLYRKCNLISYGIIHLGHFQSEELMCCLVVPDYLSHAAYMYTEDEVFACSTGTGRISFPHEKILFSASGNILIGSQYCMYSINKCYWQNFAVCFRICVLDSTVCFSI